MENDHKYGENPSGNLYDLDGRTIRVDEKFLLATVIGIITALEQVHENISNAISGISETIYEHIKEAVTSELGQTGTDTGEPAGGSESNEVA
jgi:hypothetical protein